MWMRLTYYVQIEPWEILQGPFLHLWWLLTAISEERDSWHFDSVILHHVWFKASLRSISPPVVLNLSKPVSHCQFWINLNLSKPKEYQLKILLFCFVWQQKCSKTTVWVLDWINWSCIKWLKAKCVVKHYGELKAFVFQYEWDS